MEKYVVLLKNKNRTLPILSFPSVSLLGITVRELLSSPEIQVKGIKAISDKRLDGVVVYKPFYKNALNLPDYFRFGFEIEALMDHIDLIEDMQKFKNQTLFNFAF